MYICLGGTLSDRRGNCKLSGSHHGHTLCECRPRPRCLAAGAFRPHGDARTWRCDNLALKRQPRRPLQKPWAIKASAVRTESQIALACMCVEGVPAPRPMATGCALRKGMCLLQGEHHDQRCCKWTWITGFWLVPAPQIPLKGAE
jgi:hypothetical protein